MKVINFGHQYEIYPDDLKTHDALPAQTYKVKFNPMAGFSLTKSDDLDCTENKIYGTHQSKVDKVMRTFGRTHRALGVIMSGDKGIGKTMSVQLLASAAIRKNMPVIIVDQNHPGIAGFLDSIKQEILVVFDEFEKVFPKDDTDKTSQHDLLGLFDGMSPTKRLYVLTINELHRLSDYMLNRPGRFHYHFRYAYPTHDEVIEYLEDKVSRDCPDDIQAAANFSLKVPLNFDMLRAIAMELSYGESFEDAITDLNIMNMQMPDYDMALTLRNGLQTTTRVNTDLFKKVARVEVEDYHYDNAYSLVGAFTICTDQLVIAGNRLNIPLKAISDVTLKYSHNQEIKTITIDDIQAVDILLIQDEMNDTLKF